jgi:hypothetical protein
MNAREITANNATERVIKSSKQPLEFLKNYQNDIELQNKKGQSGGKPPFLTCETGLLESLRQRCLKGWEGWFTPALAT